MPLETEILAPLQTIMLRDSEENKGAGHHVEQVEIVFAGTVSSGAVAAAWEAMVNRTEVLHRAFVMGAGETFLWQKAKTPGRLKTNEPLPGSFGAWLREDRIRPLLGAGVVAWRAVYWPETRRFVWTFHHALLDGRSITRILRSFLNCLFDGVPPEDLAITRWCLPDEKNREEAGKFFREEFANLKWSDAGTLPETKGLAKAVRCLGKDFVIRLEVFAAAMEVSSAMILTWSWGQVVARESHSDFAIVEQVRCGPPQPATAGFSMNTLPIVIWREDDSPLISQLRRFRARLMALREFESIAPWELPEDAVRMSNGPWAGVIMVERGTIGELAKVGKNVESLTLHEGRGDSLGAAAFIRPDLRLEVEGLGNQRLSTEWARFLEKMLNRPVV